MLEAIPVGTSCFIDSNIIVYHLATMPVLSDECSSFLERVERGEISGYSSSAVATEVCHKMMLAEAAARHNLAPQGLAHRLQRQRNLIAQLSEYGNVLSTLRKVNLRVEPVSIEVLEDAVLVVAQEKLMMNDAITVAIMRRLGLIHLVTNDDNFDSLTGLTIWKPR